MKSTMKRPRKEIGKGQIQATNQQQSAYSWRPEQRAAKTGTGTLVSASSLAGRPARMAKLAHCSAYQLITHLVGVGGGKPGKKQNNSK